MSELIDRSNGRKLLSKVEFATTFWKRFWGLQFRRELPSGHGIWLSPCSSLHTCFMRFPIDVVMLDERRKIVAVRRNVQPWRLLFCERKTHSVIEVTSADAGWTVGHQVDVIDFDVTDRS
ncbi:DUF192 domain-containing protein [Rhodopirellula halodulae]|uniref:DUF192 domain-containing protein n=1 Tax=Rhodopirellula halodulae TaxID=2894198 RepID=UPI001E4A2CC2|nr:DUF192 domain-containing protein [Rhodopirellula sp. JC737]MCC9655005.1 DUF192 domain-containing protein [Rhodopirellula sp. JC737]